MRFVLCLLLGLLIGAIGASIAGNAMRQREAYPRGVMAVLQHELAAAREQARTNACASEAGERAQAHLALLAADVETATGDGADEHFRRYASDLRDAVARAGAASACTERGARLTEVANACEACHRDFR